MDDHRCPKCNKLLMAMTDRTAELSFAVSSATRSTP